MKMFLLCALVSFVVACNGPEGLPGKPGINGRDGRDGSGLTKSTRCLKFLVVDQAQALAAGLTYDVYTFADGSIMVDCEVSNSATSATGVEFYTAKKGSTRCSAQLDFDNNRSGGFWAFNLLDQSRATVTYTDLTSPYNGLTATMDCTPQ